MCTAITFKTKHHYFGRNLDLEHSYREAVTITPRNFPFRFRCEATIQHHYAMIGMALVEDDYPLYFDATNEKGLSMAGLNFPGNACYYAFDKRSKNITPFELIPWILGQCATTREAVSRVRDMNFVNIAFSDVLPLSPLHWIIADKECSVTIEALKDGVRIYDNPVGVLTNNPPFDYHMYNLQNYLNLTHDEPINRFSADITLSPYSRGMGAVGLPGDLSSASRFVRAAFTKMNSICGDGEADSVSQFFHILGAVAQQRGCVKTPIGLERTVYSCCCNTDTGIYYYTTYENRQITGIHLFHENLDQDKLVVYPLINEQQLRIEN